MGNLVRAQHSSAINSPGSRDCRPGLFIDISLMDLNSCHSFPSQAIQFVRQCFCSFDQPKLTAFFWSNYTKLGDDSALVALACHA